jgi:hypothetical protein
MSYNIDSIKKKPFIIEELPFVIEKIPFGCVIEKIDYLW